MQPGEEPFDAPPALVAPEPAAVLCGRSPSPGTVRRNEFDAEGVAQVRVERVAVIRLVADQSRRVRGEEPVVDRGLDERVFRGRSAGHV